MHEASASYLSNNFATTAPIVQRHMVVAAAHQIKIATAGMHVIDHLLLAAVASIAIMNTPWTGRIPVKELQ